MAYHENYIISNSLQCISILSGDVWCTLFMEVDSPDHTIHVLKKHGNATKGGGVFFDFRQMGFLKIKMNKGPLRGKSSTVCATYQYKFPSHQYYFLVMKINIIDHRSYFREDCPRYKLVRRGHLFGIKVNEACPDDSSTIPN